MEGAVPPRATARADGRVLPRAGRELAVRVRCPARAWDAAEEQALRAVQ